MRKRGGTRRRRRPRLPKWWGYTLLFAFFFFVERCVTSQFPIRGACPVLTPLAVAALAFWEGSYAGSVAGLGMGALRALSLGSGAAQLVWEYTAVGILVGATVHQTLGRSFLGFFLCALGTECCLEGLEILTRILFLQQPAGAVWAIAVAEGLYSLAFAPMVYLLFRWVRRDSWSETEF